MSKNRERAREERRRAEAEQDYRAANEEAITALRRIERAIRDEAAKVEDEGFDFAWAGTAAARFFDLQTILSRIGKKVD